MLHLAPLLEFNQFMGGAGEGIKLRIDSNYALSQSQPISAD
jgi:hypothetical protein